jgi:putative oxidoreductase
MNSAATNAGSDPTLVPPASPDAGVRSISHAVLRIGAGALFFMHGAPKLFGWFGGFGGEPGGTAELLSLYGLAGVLEVFGGLLILFGLFTRPVVLILAVEMLIAYGKSHLPRGLVPYENGGELALLYMFVFVLLAAWGGGPLSLDAWRARR